MAFFHDNGLFGPTFYERASKPDGIDLSTWQRLHAIRAQETALGFRPSNLAEDSPLRQEELIQAYKENSATGPVHMSLISPEGEVLALMNLTDFLDIPLLHRTLRECIAPGSSQPGTPVIPERPPPTAQVSTATDLVLHLVSRFTFPAAEISTHEAHIAAADNPAPHWEAAPPEVLRSRVAAPSQDWFTLSADQWHTLVGQEGARPGDHWAIPAAVASLFHVHFGPPGETWMLESERIDAQSLEAEILSDRAGLRHIRLRGMVRMRQAWWHVDDDEYIEARTLGFLRYDTETDRILDFKMASVDAHYRGASVRPDLDMIYGVALVNLPNPLASATPLPADEAPALPGDQF